MKKQVAVPRFGFAGMWPWSHCLISAIVTQKQPQTWHMWTYWTRFQYNFTDGHTNVNFTLFSWATQHGFSFGIFFNHLKMCKPWDFPGSSVVKTAHFHCRGTGSIPAQGTGIPYALWCCKINKIKTAFLGTPLMVQWLRICLPVQKMRVWSLVRN